MNRRDLLKAAPAAALVGVAPAMAQAETPISRLYREWDALTVRFDAGWESWKRGEMSDAAFEDQVDPLLDQRDQLERSMFAADCTSAADLKQLIAVAARYDWGIDDYNLGVVKGVERIAA